MYKSDLRLAGVSKLQGYCRQIHMNAARKFTSWDFSFGFRWCMSPIWDWPGSLNSEAIADKSAQMRPGNLPPETSLSGFVDARVRSKISRGLETPRPLQTRPHKCGQEIYLPRLPFWVLSMHESDLRSAGAMRPWGYCRQVRTNAARNLAPVFICMHNWSAWY